MDTTEKTIKLEEYKNETDHIWEEETNFTSNDNCEINVKSEIDHNLLNSTTNNMETTENTDGLEGMEAIDDKDDIEYKNEADHKWDEETNFPSYDNSEINVKNEEDYKPVYHNVNEEANLKETLENVNNIRIKKENVEIVNIIKHEQSVRNDIGIEITKQTLNNIEFVYNLPVDYADEPHSDDEQAVNENQAGPSCREPKILGDATNVAPAAAQALKEHDYVQHLIHDEVSAISNKRPPPEDSLPETFAKRQKKVSAISNKRPPPEDSLPETFAKRQKKIPDQKGSPHCERCDLSFASQKALDGHMTTAKHADAEARFRRQSKMALILRLVKKAATSATPTVPATKLVSETVGGSLRPTGTGKSVPVVTTRRIEKSNPVCADALQRVEVMDLTDDEEAVGVLSGTARHARRYISVMGRELECPEPSSVPPKNSTDSQTGNAPNVPNVSSVEADVRPSTSGSMAASKPVLRYESNDGSDLDSEYDDEFDVVPIRIHAIIGPDKPDREIPDDAEVDEPTREALGAVQRAMDVEAERLLGESNVYEWKEGFETFRGRSETFTGPTPGPLKDYDTPYDAFVDIWSKDIMEVIVRETNRYAKQTIDRLKASVGLKPSSRLHQWHDTDVDEMMTLFAVYMFMGIDSRACQEEYWRANIVLEMPKFRQLLSYNRYILLSKFLHFIDNSDVSRNSQSNGEVVLLPKLAKLAPVISHLNNKFSSLYNLKSNIAIDESLTLFKGRLSWIQAIRSKAARFGIKSYELCETLTGYLYKFRIYTGKNSEGTSTADASLSADLGDKSTKIVLDLLKGLERRGHCVMMDSFYNSPALARYLKSLGFDCLGTLNPNRKNVPREIAKIPKNVAKGTIIARHCGDLSIVAWKDTKVVNMISTYHDAETYVGSTAGKMLEKPVCVGDYNNTMAGIGLKDQKLSEYLLERKRGVKWYIKMFRRMLNTSIHNAFILHRYSSRRQNLPLMTHREFRYDLAHSIVEKHRASRLEIPVQVDTLMRLRKDLVHVPKAEHGAKNRKRCGVCYRHGKDKMVRSQCVTCGEYLCFENCWEEWHSSTSLREERSRARKRARNE